LSSCSNEASPRPDPSSLEVSCGNIEDFVMRVEDESSRSRGFLCHSLALISIAAHEKSSVVADITIGDDHRTAAAVWRSFCWHSAFAHSTILVSSILTVWNAVADSIGKNWSNDTERIGIWAVNDLLLGCIRESRTVMFFELENIGCTRDSMHSPSSAILE